MQQQRNKQRSSKSGRKQTKRRRSEWSKWLQYIKRTYGVFEKASGQGLGWLVVSSGNGCPSIPRIPRPMGPASGATVTVVQFVSNPNANTGISNSAISQTGSVAAFGATAFEAGDLPNITQLAQTFDQYRFEAVHLKFRSRNRSFSGIANAPAADNQPPLLAVVIDRDDNTALSSLGAIAAYDNVVEATYSDDVDVIIEPSVTPAVYSGGAFSGYGIEKAKDLWLDCANTSIPYYGVKWAFTPTGVSNAYVWAWDVQCWYKVSFRNVR